jgi:hypothetical protein
MSQARKHETAMKNGVFWVVTPCGSCKNRLLEEPGASFIRVRRLLVAACVVPSSPIFVTLMKEAPHGVTTQKTPFFIVTAVKTSNLT